MTNTQPSRRRSVVAGLAVILACAVSEGAEGPRQHRKLSEKVREEASAKDANEIDVIVRFRQQPGASERSLVRTFGGKIHHQFRSSHWLAVRLPARSLPALADNPAVEFVTTDAPVWATMDVARQTANEPAATEHESSLKGAGVTIAIVDSGVAPHPAIRTLVAAVDFVGAPEAFDANTLFAFAADNRVAGYDPTSGTWTVDLNGHGTHVAGIMVGHGSQSSGGKHRGIAPKANLVSVRVLDEFGRGRTSDVLAGLQWVADHKTEHGIRVVNLALGHPVFEPAADDPLVQAVDALWDAGIVVVCSAGNAGRSGDGTIASPCNSRKVITVGALNDRNTPDPTDDTVATYSSRGPTRIDLVAKPDIVAPGNRIVSTRAPGSYLDVVFPERRVADNPNHPKVMAYFEMSGTSMAAPLVSGTAALMLEQDPSLNPGTVKARLMLSARKPMVGSPFATGAGALDILAALRTSGRVSDAPSPLVFPDRATGRVAFESTAVLWSDSFFSLAALFPNAVLWSDGTQWDDPLIWSDGVLWPDATLWPDSTLWPDATLWPDSTLWNEGILWPDATLWPDSILWSDAVLWPDEAVLGPDTGTAGTGTTRRPPKRKH